MNFSESIKFNAKQFDKIRNKINRWFAHDSSIDVADIERL